jgi:hypothetical protein
MYLAFESLRLLGKRELIFTCQYVDPGYHDIVIYRRRLRNRREFSSSEGQVKSTPIGHSVKQTAKPRSS